MYGELDFDALAGFDGGLSGWCRDDNVLRIGNGGEEGREDSSREELHRVIFDNGG